MWAGFWVQMEKETFSSAIAEISLEKKFVSVSVTAGLLQVYHKS